MDGFVKKIPSLLLLFQAEGEAEITRQQAGERHRAGEGREREGEREEREGKPFSFPVLRMERQRKTDDEKE